MTTSVLVRTDALARRGTRIDEGARQGLSSRGKRHEPLDFTKGALVVIMVVYHWLNYFVDVQWDVYRYLRFLTPSFIFIAGFIVSYIYSIEAFAADSKIRNRLLQRGFKLLALFTVLNLGANLVVSRSYDGRPLGILPFISNAYAVYVTGNGRALFDVLVPIAYFLLLAPAVLTMACRSRYVIPASAVVALALAWAVNASGAPSPNLELVAMALLGMVAGTVPIERVGGPLRQPALLAAAYAAYLAAIARWNVIFPLQIIGVCLSVLAIYVIGRGFEAARLPRRSIVQLGEYSLFGYIAQVAILQVLRRVLQSVDLEGARALFPFVTALLATVLAVAVVSALRKRSGPVDRLYRVVFA